jgi:hypothetical protein
MPTSNVMPEYELTLNREHLLGLIEALGRVWELDKALFENEWRAGRRIAKVLINHQLVDEKVAFELRKLYLEKPYREIERYIE